MNALDWLQKPAGIDRGEDDVRLPYLERIPTALEYLTELVYVNHGKLRPENVGQVQLGKGAYGRIGLTLQDAFHLVNLVSCLEGIYIGTDASDVLKTAVSMKIQEEITRVEALLLEFLKKEKKLPVLPTPDQVEAVSKGTLALPTDI